MQIPSLQDLATPVGVSVMTFLLVQLILNVSAMPDAWQNRWGPLIALGIGVVVAEVANVALGGPVNSVTVTNSLYVGIVGGLISMGNHGIATKSAVSTLVQKAFGITKAEGPQAEPPQDVPILP